MGYISCPKAPKVQALIQKRKTLKGMQENTITITSNRRELKLDASSILYIDLDGRKTIIHLPNKKTYETYMTIEQLEKELGDKFFRASRACLVAKNAIHKAKGENIELINGETLYCTRRRKHALKDTSKTAHRDFILTFNRSSAPKTPKEYQLYYASFDNLPIAFTDIEMIFNEEHSATDWRFRYVNKALEHIENLPRKELLANSFRTLFPNMDDKWLCTYERSVIYGETLEVMDYSPEVKKFLKVICFPTFEGHCGCLLFDLSEIHPTKTNSPEVGVIEKYIQELLP